MSCIRLMLHRRVGPESLTASQSRANLITIHVHADPRLDVLRRRNVDEHDDRKTRQRLSSDHRMNLPYSAIPGWILPLRFFHLSEACLLPSGSSEQARLHRQTIPARNGISVHASLPMHQTTAATPCAPSKVNLRNRVYSDAGDWQVRCSRGFGAAQHQAAFRMQRLLHASENGLSCARTHIDQNISQ